MSDSMRSFEDRLKEFCEQTNQRVTERGVQYYVLVDSNDRRHHVSVVTLHRVMLDKGIY